MARQERTRKRSLIFSAWHREGGALERLLGRWRAMMATMVDGDGLQYCPKCRHIVCVIETARRTSEAKPWPVLQQLAADLGVPGYCILYDVNEGKYHDCPSCTCGDTAAAWYWQRSDGTAEPITEERLAELVWQPYEDHRLRCPKGSW